MIHAKDPLTKQINRMKINETALLAAFKNNYNKTVHLESNASGNALHDLTNESLRSMLKHSNDIITFLDDKGVILFESPSIEKILGYTQEELVGRNAFEFIHKEDLKYVFDFFNESLK